MLFEIATLINFYWKQIEQSNFRIFKNCLSSYLQFTALQLLLRKALKGIVPESPGGGTHFPNGSAEAIAILSCWARWHSPFGLVDVIEVLFLVIKLRKFNSLSKCFQICGYCINVNSYMLSMHLMFITVWYKLCGIGVVQRKKGRDIEALGCL